MLVSFNSRDKACKSPFGAVAQGTEVRLTLRASRELAISQAIVNITYEMEKQTENIAMSWIGLEDGMDGYSATLPTADRLGLVWYAFCLKRYDRADMFVGCDTIAADGSCVFSESGNHHPFQLTVYDATQNTPDWFGRGVTYHIFPDRFRRLDLPDPRGLVGNRTLHECWEDTPEFLPDSKGEILNRDFYGGSIAGILEKLPYLRSLGVTTLYLSPIFEAASNHRYDTADYHNVDPLFGTQSEFQALCERAGDMGIRIILDGVFNHTGFNSRYFNGHGAYPEPGAYQSRVSPYFSWYDFTAWPDKYAAWWGIYTLPQVREDDPAFMSFILDGPDSVVRRWLKAGAAGWRLDVADELPDEFIRQLRASARAEKPDAVVIGEVWEDASTKVAYNVRRRYLLGDELDGVMNYPLRNALIDYLLHGNARGFKNRMETLRENYPEQAFFSLMNIIGTHDTPRILTVLGVEGYEYNLSRGERAAFRLPEQARRRGVSRLKLASLIQFAFPGSPCVYYGDEAGLQGFEDPFNRMGYPWGREDRELVEWYGKLGIFRLKSEALQAGEIRYLHTDGALLAFDRTAEGQRVMAVTNAGETQVSLSLPWQGDVAQDVMTGAQYPVSDDILRLTIPSLTGMLLT